MKNKKQLIWFTIIFAVIGFIALQIPVTQLVGSKAKFSLFDAFAPTATGFLGMGPGIIAVFLMRLVDFLVHGAEVSDIGTIIRFFPVLFGAFYFAKKSKASVWIPVIAIAAFNIHPIGRTVWYFSALWLIPIAAHFVREKSLLARSLGATFTQHSVGGALWIWAFSTPAIIWQGLIPVVLVERALFTVGIAVTYVVFSNVFEALKQKNLAVGVPVEKRFLFKEWKRLLGS
ncbi:hypothetical protein CL634_04255 [bacterium]|nr:hypothetical protein [bacterium]|tara:strand:+ start:63 stop:752 length:690 start_codon:yes stop_codon:yes gene_type:complete